MGSKAKLALIESEAERAATMKRLTEELVKETEELSTICGVDTLLVVYNGPNYAEPSAVWPPDPTKVMERYMAMSVAERTANTSDIESELIKKIEKMERKQAEQIARNKKLEFDVLMDEVHYGKGLDNFDPNELALLEQHLNERIAELKRLKLKGVREGAGEGINDAASGSGSGELGNGGSTDSGEPKSEQIDN